MEQLLHSTQVRSDSSYPISTALTKRNLCSVSVLLQELHDAGVTPLARYIQRSSPILLGLIDLGKASDHLQMTTRARNVQRIAPYLLV